MSSNRFLNCLAAQLRTELRKHVKEIRALAGGIESDSRPSHVVEAEKVIRTGTFGCHSKQVAELCSALTGHTIRPLPTFDGFPSGSIVANGFEGEELFYIMVGGVKGWGRNIFSNQTGMNAAGEVDTLIAYGHVRPATESEIRQFIKKATLRALLIMAEILEL